MQNTMKEINVSILIVNYNSHEHTKKCLDSIYKHTKNIIFDIHILDNNSRETGFEKIESYKEENIYTYRSESNMGFGKGINFLSDKARGEYLLFLNPDTYFNSNTIDELYSFALTKDDIGICSPAILNGDGSLNYNFNYFPDFIWEVYELFGLGYGIRLKKLSRTINLYKSKRETIKIDWMTGACIFIKKDLFLEVGRFDERFYLYYEDVDLQKRLKKSGKCNYCLPYLEVYHISNASSMSDREVYYTNLLKSKLLYFSKYYSHPKILLNKTLIFIGYYVRLIILSLRRERSNQFSETKKRYLESLKILFKY